MSAPIKQYTVFAYLDDDVAELDMHEEDDGTYVLHTDHLAAMAAASARVAELEQALKFARTTLAVIATSQHLSAVERRSAQSEVNRIDALMCAAPPNITPSSEHKVPVGITHISRSLGRAIVRFKTSEQLNDFYRAAKASIPSPQ